MRLPKLKSDARLEFALALLRMSPPFAVLLVLLAALSIALGMGFTVASGVVVGSVPGALRSGLASAAGARLIGSLVALLALFWVMQAMEPLHDELIGALGRRMGGTLRGRAMRASLGPVGTRHLEDPALQNLVTRVRSAITGPYTADLAVLGLDNLLLKVFQSAASTALIWVYYRWWLALGLVLLLVAVRTRIRRQVLEAAEAMTYSAPSLRRAEYYLDLALVPTVAKETRVFGLAEWLVERFRTSWLGSMRSVWEERHRKTRSSAPWALAVVLASVLASLALVGRDAASGVIGLTALTVTLQSVATLVRYLFSINLPELWLDYGSAVVPAVRDLEAATREPAPLGTSTEGMPRGSIRFEDVYFRYPHGGTKVYRGLDLEIPAGRSVAIVGANGAGKTTLVKLLTRMYEPDRGRITVDGVDLGSLDPRGWRRQVAVIFQDFVRYELTARENVGFGAIERVSDERALGRAAERAGASELIRSLPRRWDTPLSRRYSDGVDLSGGQWQRVALARALFAVEAGARVLVLDEPTASLDVRAEAEMFERFLELTKGLTTVLISHRFSTVRRAELIYVFESGRVVESGGHEELLEANGLYARLFRLQAARFLEDVGDG